MAEPGEYYNVFTGELGGVWRNGDRHPQKMMGAVFSVGAIAWCGSLSYSQCHNTVPRVTGNVLTKFSTAEKLPTFDDRQNVK